MMDELSTILVIRNYFAANGSNSPDLIILLSRYLKHYCSQCRGVRGFAWDQARTK